MIRFFKKPGKALYHAPRFMGFALFYCFNLCFSGTTANAYPGLVIVFILITDLATYFIFHWIFERIKDRQEEKALDRYRNITLILLAALFLFAGFYNSATVYLICLPMMQLGFLFLVIIRRKITETELLLQKMRIEMQPKLSRLIFYTAR